MKRIIDTLSDPVDHLALDEAILLEADDVNFAEAIRFWQFCYPVIVVGRSSRVSHEVNRSLSEQRKIPILRRASGGTSVVAGPGCLMYSVVLSYADRPELRSIDQAHRFVMKQLLMAMQNQLPEVRLQGTCDLTWRNRKCSGNSLRMARSHLLYHGTILYDFDIDLIGQLLGDAPRQPKYRDGRDHRSFLTNVKIDPDRLSADLCDQFNVSDELQADLFFNRVGQLRQSRYDLPEWHFRH